MFPLGGVFGFRELPRASTTYLLVATVVQPLVVYVCLERGKAMLRCCCHSQYNVS